MKSSKVIIHLFGRYSGNVFSNFSHLNSFLVSAERVNLCDLFGDRVYRIGPGG
jgi:hypothetical protein